MFVLNLLEELIIIYFNLLFAPFTTSLFNDKTSISLDSGNIFNHSHKYIKNICAKSNFVICKYSEHTHELVYGSPKKARVYIVKKK